jgi:hypothetical protein
VNKDGFVPDVEGGAAKSFFGTGAVVLAPFGLP